MRSSVQANTVRGASFSRTLLWVNVVLFGAYGLVYLIAPDLVTQLLAHTAYPNADVAIDARAVYGGLSLGLAVFCWLSARGGGDVQRIGQLGCAAAYGLVALGRLIGMLVTATVTPLMVVLLVAEALFAALSWSAARMLQDHRSSPRV